MVDEVHNHHQERSYFDTTPEEILVEILVRMRVKSLLCCKCVCKHWLSLIGSPDFVSKHMRYQQFKGKTCFLQNQYCSVSSGSESDPEKIVYTLSDYAKSGLDNITEYEVGESDCTTDINGPVNGLFCVHSRVGIAIWNPSTSEVLPFSLPKANDKVPPTLPFDSSVAFLGFDPRSNHNNDYKVLLISKYQYRDYYDLVDFTVSYQIYSLKTNSWRHVKTDTDIPSDVYDVACLRLDAPYLDGVYFWWDDANHGVISFDMGTEVFREFIPAQPGIAGCVRGLFTFPDDDTRFCLLTQNTFDPEAHMDTWVMEKESSCWTKRPSTILATWFCFLTNPGYVGYSGYNESLVSFNGRKGTGVVAFQNLLKECLTVAKGGVMFWIDL